MSSWLPSKKHGRGEIKEQRGARCVQTGVSAPYYRRLASAPRTRSLYYYDCVLSLSWQQCLVSPVFSFVSLCDFVKRPFPFDSRLLAARCATFTTRHDALD